MHIIKPSWLLHAGENRDHEIYSCHVSPDGSRLATAAGDAHVRIWSIDAILNSARPDYTKPKQLAALSTHSGTIHTVRFSGNNKYLASGADDKVVCVYGLDPNPPSHSHAFGSNDPPPVENWRVSRRLIGHDNDVQDIGWSCDSSILVSVGLDSKVVIWSGHTFERLKTLMHHQSHVKGITFDPANKYFATASDDRSIKVYRFTSPPPNATQNDQVNNFVLEKTITAPFASSPLTTYFRRPSWSPDGNHIAAANAVNGPVSSVAIVNRGSWDSDINLIGHEGPVEVCSFSPRMFHRQPLTQEHVDAHGHPLSPSVTVVACAGQDKTLSVWNTSFARPFVITQELANKSISDLSWSPDGEKLYASSLDGGIIAVIFEPGELGYPASLQENERALTKYGAGRKAGIIEGPDALLLEEGSKAGEIRGVQGRMGELMGDGAHHQPAPPTAVNGEGSKNGTAPIAVLLPSTTNGASQSNANQEAAPPPAEDKRVHELKNRVEVVNGKKRIKPLLVGSSSNMPQSSLPQTQLVSAAAHGKASSDAPASILDLSRPYDGLPKGGMAALLVGNKRKYAEIEGDPDRRIEKRLGMAVQNGSAPIVMNSRDGLVPPSLAKETETGISDALRPAIVDPALAVSQIRLAVPVLRSVITRNIMASDHRNGDGEEGIILEARNATGPSRTGRAQDRDPTRVNCTKNGQPLWQDFLPKPVLLVTGNQNFWAATCEDGSVYIWTPAGRRLWSTLVLEAQPCIMDCRGWWLMCISAVGTLRVWDARTLEALHPPVSVGPILDIAAHSQGPHLSPSPGIVFARLSTQGRVVVAMSNGDGYTYSPTGFIWQRLSEPWWAVASQYWSTTDPSVTNLGSKEILGSKENHQGGMSSPEDTVSAENISAGIIPLLERNTTLQSLIRGRSFFLMKLIKALINAESFEGLEASVSVAHLENRVAAAMSLGAREEFKVYLLMYAKRLGSEGLRGKIEELLRTLLGDEIYAGRGSRVGVGGVSQAQTGWYTPGKTICGWDRIQLSKEVILVLGKHRDLQRLTLPYARLLGVLDERDVGTTTSADMMIMTS